MLYFYQFNKKATKKMYFKALRLQAFTASWSKWYLFLKFNRRHTTLIPKLQSWGYRSLYTNKRHFRQKENAKKMVLLHLFWILDVWKLAHPMAFKGISTSFPIRFECALSNSLDVYSSFQKWVTLYGLNKNKVLPYAVTSGWLQNKPDLWVTRPYHQYASWYLKNKKHYQHRRNNKRLWFLNTWYLENGSYHTLQNRLYCQVPSSFPLQYTRVLWMRLMQYPCLYNYQWLPMLRHLSLYSNRTPLPWDLTYNSQQTWMFDYKAVSLVVLLKALVKQRMQITEYILVKRWKDLLMGQDLMSRSFQIFIRTSVFFRRYLNNLA